MDHEVIQIDLLAKILRTYLENGYMGRSSLPAVPPPYLNNGMPAGCVCLCA